MDQFDLQVTEVLSTLAAIVNRASREKATSAEDVKVVDVPLALMYQAKRALKWFSDTEFGTNTIRQALDRDF